MAELAPLEPAYDVDASPSPVWRGPAHLSCLDEPRETDVAFDWSRYRVVFQQPGGVEETLRGFFSEEDLSLSLAGSDGVGPLALLEDHEPIQGVLGGPLSAGEDTSVTHLKFHIVNLPDYNLPGLTAPGPDGAARRCLSVTGGGWTLRINTRPTTKALKRELRRGRRYAVTHIGQLSRSDGRAFDAGEVGEALTAVQMLLSFVRGAFVAPGLPVGYESDGDPVWWEAGERFASPGLGRGVSWHDRLDERGLESVAVRWLEHWQGPLWPQVLHRATLYYLEANRQGDGSPSFLDFKIVAAQSGLELLAWTLLETDPPLDLPAVREDGTAAGRLRTVLKWAGIPIPQHMAPLDAYATENNCQDLVHALTWIRNTVTHPKLTNGQFGHPTEVLRQTWQVLTWMLELLLLRVLGYEGAYGNRLQLARREGRTEQVPWAPQ